MTDNFKEYEQALEKLDELKSDILQLVDYAQRRGFNDGYNKRMNEEGGTMSAGVVSLCQGCHCMTRTVQKECIYKLHFVCGKCGEKK